MLETVGSHLKSFIFNKNTVAVGMHAQTELSNDAEAPIYSFASSSDE